MKKFKNTIILFAIFFFCIVSNAFAENNNEFRLGVISDQPGDKIEDYILMVKYIASRLNEFNIKTGKIVIAKDVDEMLKNIKDKEVDLIFESAVSTIEMKEKAGIKPALAVWRKGVREYRTLFFARKESPVKTISDLKGKTIVFEDPKSTSAYALPKAELRQNGLTVLPMEEKGTGNNAVKYVFASQELNQAFYVLQKRADAGAFSDNDWNELSEKIKAELKIIHEIKPVIRYIGSFHPGISEKLKKAVEDILIDMDKNQEGKDALKQASKTKKIERMTDNDFKSLEYVKELMRFID